MTNSIALRIPVISRMLLSANTLKTKIFLMSLMVLFFSLLLVYFFQLGQWISAEYSVSNLQNQNSQLESENLEIKSQIDNAFLSQNMEEQMTQLGYVKVDKITYIPLQQNHLAQNTTN